MLRVADVEDHKAPVVFDGGNAKDFAEFAERAHALGLDCALGERCEDRLQND